MGALIVPPLIQIPLDMVHPDRVEEKKEKEILRPQPTASSRLRSRGLHPVGALSVPPLVRIPLDMVRPD